MFTRSNWVSQKWQKILSALNPVPPEALPNIHETPSQDIQGGSSGQHFHLTAAELVLVQNPTFVEPVVVVCEPIFSDDGEIISTEVLSAS